MNILQNNHLFENSHYKVFQGYYNDRSGIIKELKKTSHPLATELIEREINIFRNYGLDELIAPVESGLNNKRKFLCYINLEGTSLEDILTGSNIDITSAVRLILRLSRHIEKIHKKGLVHCNIHPGSIISSPDNEKIKLICFESARLCDDPVSGPSGISENRDMFRPEYISPELTGIIRKPVDHRTDIYSLGIVFYQLLTGHVPFKSDNLTEIFHWHVAAAPVEPSKFVGGISSKLNHIVMKLLEKDPENRYQDISEVIYELQRILPRKSKKLNDTLTMAKLPPYPDSIIGRDKEKKELLNILNQVISGQRGISLVSGYPGTGKTELVKLLKDEIHNVSGLFIDGKCEQYAGAVPLHPVIQALVMVTRQILTRNEAAVLEWKDRIKTFTSPNTGLLLKLIPELVHITGKAGAVPETDPGNEDKRLLATISNFLYSFAEKDHPVILFIDDLQWADPLTLAFFRHIALVDHIPCLHVIGTYRDNEINDTHPLIKIIEEIEQQKILHKLHLHPLDKICVGKFFRNWISDDNKTVNKLTDLAFKKSGGNPLALKEFCNIIRNRSLICKNETGLYYTDYESIKRLPVSERIVTLITEMIKDLPPGSQKILASASCIGAKFDSNLLASAEGIPHSQCISILKDFCSKDFLIYHKDTTYAFIHDRVQQAAYELLTPEKRRNCHMKIGNALLLALKLNCDNSKLFETVEQFYLADPLWIRDKKICKTLCPLFLNAAEKAEKTSAYSNAVKYLKLTETMFKLIEKKRNEKFSLYFNMANCLYLDSKYEEAVETLHKAADFAETSLEHVELNTLTVGIYILITRYKEAIDVTLHTLKYLDIVVKNKDVPENIIKEKAGIDAFLKERGTKGITSLKLCKDPLVIAVQKLLFISSHAAYFTNKFDYLQYLPLKLASLALEYGLTVYSAYGFMIYCMILPLFHNNFDDNQKLADIVIQMAKKFNNYSMLSGILMHYSAFYIFWHHHMKEGRDLNIQAIEYGKTGGDYINAGNAVGHIINNDIHIGNPVTDILRNIETFTPFIKKINNITIADILKGYTHIFTKFSTSSHFSPEEEDIIFEDKFIHEAKADKSLISLGHYFINNAMYHYFMKNDELAEKNMELSDEYNSMTSLLFQNFDKILFESLIRIRLLYSKNYSGKKAKIINSAKNTMKYFNTLMKNCPDNFEFRYFLLDAELARLNNDMITTMASYDHAIESAYKYGYNQYEAIASEQAGEFWLIRGKQDFAELYLKRAYSCYKQWGAVRKVESLHKTYPEIFFTEESEENEIGRKEVYAFLRSFTTLSGIQDTESLLKDLTGIVLEHSGAEKFILIIEKEQKLFIQAIGNINPGEISVNNTPLPENDCHDTISIPTELIRYVHRTGENIISENLSIDPLFKDTPYIKKFEPRSVMCIKKAVGDSSFIWYLENNLLEGAFVDPSKNNIFAVLTDYAAICVKNSLIYNKTSYSMNDHCLSVKTNGNNYIIPFDDILYISAHGRKSVLSDTSQSYEIHQSLKEMEEQLPSGLFLRIHRQFIVNINYIRQLKRFESGKYMVILKDEEDSNLPVSRLQINRLRSLLKIS